MKWTKAWYTPFLLNKGVSINRDGFRQGPAFRKSVPSTTGFNKRFLQENKSRNTGTSRSVGGSAVTGHTKNKLKTGAPSKASLSARSSSVSTSNVNRQVKPAESMLSVIADKRHHFA